MAKNSTHGGISIMQILFLVLLLVMFVMLWVITRQAQIIMELNHKINILELEMKGNEAVNAVTFALKKYKPSLQLKQEVKG